MKNGRQGLTLKTVNTIKNFTLTEKCKKSYEFHSDQAYACSTSEMPNLNEDC